MTLSWLVKSTITQILIGQRARSINQKSARAVSATLSWFVNSTITQIFIGQRARSINSRLARGY